MTRGATLALLLLAGTVLAQPGRRFQPMVPAEPPPAIRLAPIVPPEWTLLSQPAVRAELGLTKEQSAALEGFQNLAAGEAVSAATLGWLPPAAGRALVSAGRDAFLATGLTKAQQARLKQVFFQLKEREFGAHAAFAMSARDLGLRPDQKEDVSWLKGQRVDEIAKLVTSGERFEKVKGQVSAANTDTFEKMAEMLTRTQRERLKELRGKPFAGKVDLGPTGESPARKYPKELFGLYSTELEYLADPAVRDELKITDDQARKIDGESAGWRVEFNSIQGSTESRIAALHDRTAKAITGILTAEQQARFAQLMMRERALAGPEAMCGHPAAVAALKLTPVQLQQLADGKPVADVLTMDQLAASEKLLGPPPAGLVGYRDPFLPPLRRVAGADPTAAFARHFLVIADRLKLSADQVKKLRELAEDEPKFFDLIQRELDFADTPPVTGAGRGLTVAGAVADKYRGSVEKQCWDVLDEKQRSLAAQFYGKRR